MTKLTYVYVAGKYRGKASHDYNEYYEIDRNISYAAEAAATLAKLDIPFFCPHLNSSHFEVIIPSVTPEYWLETDMIFVDLASCLFVLEGWEESEGTKKEIVRVASLEKPVFYFFELDKLVEFWRKNESCKHKWVVDTSVPVLDFGQYGVRFGMCRKCGIEGKTNGITGKWKVV